MDYYEKFNDDFLNIRNELLNGTLNELLINIDEGEDLIIRENNCIYHITTPNNQNNNEYEDISIIKLNECEKELRDHYKIDDDDTLLIFKIDYYEKNLLIPIVEYEIYSSKTKKKLDLVDMEQMDTFHQKFTLIVMLMQLNLIFFL